MGDTFPWYFDDGMVKSGDGKYQFTHGFLKNNNVSPYFSIIEPCINKLGCNRLVRVKANLNHKTLFHKRSEYHVDQTGAPSTIKTAILYVNTCNGWTRFKKGGKVKSVANRVVIFDNDLEHAGVSCTDENRRVVINFNYE